ncbi:MAG TPA: tetratricopeptide repeat protein, partial [Vicinamibacteria bacterium]|nr:tetratricopeptide repeat protein [Vicinamibacteria bacterium]
GLEQSLALAERAIALDPHLSRAWVAKGYVTLRRGDFEEAVHAYRRAIEIDPGDHLGHYFVGVAQHYLRRPEEAIPPFQRSLELEPRMGIGWLGLGGVFLDLGRLQESGHAFERALALESDPAVVFPTAGAASYLAEVARLEGRATEARTLALAGIAASEASDHAYRDLFRGYGLGVLGRAALDLEDAESARAAFGQLLAMLKGRPKVRAGGHLVVRALAGLARVNASPESLDEGLALFADRGTYSFEPFAGCLDASDLFELALASRALGRTAEAAALLARARAAGSREPFPGEGPA